MCPQTNFALAKGSTGRHGCCTDKVCVVSPGSTMPAQDMHPTENSPQVHRAQGVPPTVSLALGANRKGKGRVKGKASRIQSSRIGSALVYVRRNAQHPEPKLPESTRFVLNTVLVVAVSTRGSTGPLLPLPSRPKTYSHTKNPSRALGHEVKHQP